MLLWSISCTPGFDLRSDYPRDSRVGEGLKIMISVSLTQTSTHHTGLLCERLGAKWKGRMQSLGAAQKAGELAQLWAP